MALTVSGILFALLTAAFIAHNRLTAGTAAIAELRAQSRQAQQIIPGLLAATPSSNVRSVSDTLVDFDYTIASAVSCLDTAPTQLMLAPDTIANGQRLASWTHLPRAGDIAHIFDAGASAGAADDIWHTAEVTGTVPVPNGCAGSVLLDPVADANHQARVAALLWLSAPPASILTGAAVRFTRRSRTFLYAASGKSYLGFSGFDVSTNRWSVVQPVSGPYEGAAAAGIQFVPLDSLGNRAAATPTSLALMIRAQTAIQLRIPGFLPAARAESLSTHVALRNR
jgi:hypothetical protein